VLRDVGQDPTALRQLQELAARYGVQARRCAVLDRSPH
jgi:predicted O-linked N-acetylglucosamine transferase (SPINDLY family)